MNQNEKQDKQGESLIVVTFTDPRQHEFLLQVLDIYVRKGGIGAAELPVAADVFVRLVNAQVVPLQASVGKVGDVEVTPSGVAMTFAQSDMLPESAESDPTNDFFGSVLPTRGPEPSMQDGPPSNRRK